MKQSLKLSPVESISKLSKISMMQDKSAFSNIIFGCIDVKVFSILETIKVNGRSFFEFFPLNSSTLI